MDTIKQGEKYKVVDKNCSNYGEILTIEKVFSLETDKGDVCYRYNEPNPSFSNTKVWWIKAHCKKVEDAKSIVFLAKEYRDKLQKAEDKRAYFDRDIDAMNDFINWLEKKQGG